MKYIKFIITAIIFIGLAVWGYQKLQGNKKIIDDNAQIEAFVVQQIPVYTEKVSQATLSNKAEIVGTFEARKELSVIAETQGRITDLYVQEGQPVSKGQDIAKIDDSTIQAQLNIARASIEKATKDVERYQNLLKVGAISQTQYEEVELALGNQESNLAGIEQQLQYTTATSPMSGIVKDVLLEQGSFATPSKEIVTIVDISQLNMIVRLDEKEVVKVRKGKKVNITTEVYEDVIFTGTINQIAVQADASRKYEVQIQVANSRRHPLKAGMYGTALIPFSDDVDNEAMVIPRKSVVGSVMNPQVYIFMDGKAKLREIEVGENIDDKVIVLSGLTIGDEVITTGQINLEDGREVKAITTNTLANNQ